jgi:hypothetical protein
MPTANRKGYRARRNPRERRPLGNDLLDVRYASLHAAEQEYAVVFPEYYFGQIFEAMSRAWNHCL